MKIVEFTRDMAPHGIGDTRIVPDLLAEMLAAEGAVTNVRPWPDAPDHRPDPKHYLPRVKRPERTR